ncbi:MAG: DUF2493 domain-containing protein [Planctomycetes bacterium]|nr:DUF2493 domain-containing protein [Planctomycetota bacterium]
MKRILVCGSRSKDHEHLVEAELDRQLAASPAGIRLIHGGNSGVAAVANAWAWGRRALGGGVEVSSFPLVGEETRAPRRFRTRNVRMLKQSRPQLVLAFPGDEESEHLVAIARIQGIPVVEFAEGALVS